MKSWEGGSMTRGDEAISKSRLLSSDKGTDRSIIISTFQQKLFFFISFRLMGQGPMSRREKEWGTFSFPVARAFDSSGLLRSVCVVCVLCLHFENETMRKIAVRHKKPICSAGSRPLLLLEQKLLCLSPTGDRTRAPLSLSTRSLLKKEEKMKKKKEAAVCMTMYT